MAASSTILRPRDNETAESDEPVFLTVTAQESEVRPRASTVLSLDAARAALLAYAAFMLDQQARYCQQ